MRIILASGSPRRKELLGKFIPSLEIIPSRADEPSFPELGPAETVKKLALIKAREVAGREAGRGDMVIGADTVVTIDNKILGKPRDEAHAGEMLRALSGSVHDVFTGVCIIKDWEECCFAEKTEVYFRRLTDYEIDAYIASGEPMDKAGAYGIQGIASLFVEKINGDYFNVMGFPVCAAGKQLEKMGVKLI